MTGLTFASTWAGQRVIGNKVGAGYEMPEGWKDNAPQPTWTGKVGKDNTAVMLLLQPDKTLDLKPSECSMHTYIRDFKKTEELVEVLQKKTAEELQDAMGLGKKLAKSHLERFQNFQRFPAKQACLIFGGESLAAADWSDDGAQWADRHIRIISGLYGVLRPYDDVKPVRDLPMGAKLATKKGSHVFDFWLDSVTKQLAKDINELNKRHDEKVLLVVCCTEEYWRVVQATALPPCADVVRLSFEGATEDNVKRAWGLFARHVVRKRVANLEGLQDFSHDDWAFDKTSSRESKLVFNWDGDASGALVQKPAAAKKKAGACDPGYHSSGSSGCDADEGPQRDQSQSSARGGQSNSRSRGRGRKNDSKTPARTKHRSRSRRQTRRATRRRDSSRSSRPAERKRRRLG
mmetsp:Transcript_84655/g.262951  ORF Transcript_84655/g.262951 Transcript_84655/m.262951 type:complete len:404 (-) Transcript_84655:50-1261(-)